MYKETIKQEQQLGLRNEIADKSLRLQPATVVSKVNTICDTFLGILEQRRGAHVQNIITAHCCKDPPDLDSGLLEVSRIQRNRPAVRLERSLRSPRTRLRGSGESCRAYMLPCRC